jgi:transaldolase/glucose-6-phosphate isomerase
VTGRFDQSFDLGSLSQPVDAALNLLRSERIVDRIWRKDPSVWKSDEGHRKIISNALGWLEVIELTRGQLEDLRAFSNEVRSEFDQVVVLGMGGSSLCPEVLARTFGRVDGVPRLLVLDSTVPAAVLALERSLDLLRTLFIVASKSGTTTEPQVFHRYFYEAVRRSGNTNPGTQFIAITDPGTQLTRDAERDRFRKIFLNPADIGGRYSALSLFGMVPAALSGFDVEAILRSAADLAGRCHEDDLQNNPGAFLGAAIASAAKNGRDKLTIVAASPVDSVGLWIEQLIAESTGKEGTGILPVAGEPLLNAYGSDRLFVSIGVGHSAVNRNPEGAPGIVQTIGGATDLGALFFVWEFATAVAGALLGIDAFDQPNVQESKDNTRQLLDTYRNSGALPAQAEVAKGEGLTLFGTSPPAGSVEAALRSHFASIRPGDYMAFTEYFEESEANDRILAGIRKMIGERFKVATTTGYGPRFLHSTGQLHKGGPASGVFLQMTSDDREDLPIPGEPFTFGTLKSAQALGDFQSLANRHRRALRVHMGSEVTAGLRQLSDLIAKSI